MVVGEVEVDQSLEGAQRAFELAEHEQRLAQPGERIFVLVVEGDGGVERGTGPRILLARELGITDADMEFDSLGIAEQPVPEEGESGIVASFVVELVGLFVVLIRATKRLRHGEPLPR